MMSQSDFHKNAGRWGGSDVATRHYRAAVLSNLYYADLWIMPTIDPELSLAAVIAAWSRHNPIGPTGV
ncbi:MAG: hypothetical protein WCE52_04745 [Candidatus Acidiferrum sp.]